MAVVHKPKLAVWKFASCDGCQLSLLDCEDELLTVAGAVEIAYFPEATRAMVKGPYDLSLVEGSITTPHDVELIQQFVSVVYASPQYINTLATSTPIGDHVAVDFELRGCPISKYQLLESISALLFGRKPNVAPYSVCMDCKRQGVVCVMVAHGTPCMGPVTQTGCGVLCPSYDRGCYNCFGPKETPNTESLAGWWSRLGVTEQDLVRAFRTFNAWAEPFRKESVAHEQ
jgi:coenzyme F420-reducing hydrogenase gamma subunit